MNGAIATARLATHCITHSPYRQPEDLVAWLGAVQAQDYPAAKWALGLRLKSPASERDIEAAVHDGRVLRTHVLRPTWHFVTPRDLDWMLELTSARVQKLMAHPYRTFQLDSAIRVQAARVMERALRDGRPLTFAELGSRLAKAGLPSRGTALALLTVYAELERVMCSGPFRGRDLTYIRYSTRVPVGRKLSADEALAALARRYFQSHGPATTRDFMWWSTLTARDAKRGLEMNDARSEIVDGITYWTVGEPPAAPRARRSTVHLLPIYDEYLVAYRDRVAVPLGQGRGAATQLGPVLVINDHIAGTWKTVQRDREIGVNVAPTRRLTGSERMALEEVVQQYGRFLGTVATLSVT